MALARFKDICIDAVDAAASGRFWAEVLGLEFHRKDNGDARLTGPTPFHTVWINQVPEPKTVKNRMHLDVHGTSIAALEAIGATVIDADSFRWKVLADPDAPFESLTFSSVPEPKGAKNRVHLDLVADGIDGLLGAGAALLRARDDEIGWNVLADPEGNEFCVFSPR